ncbi:hypothetical protein Dda3937_04539 [Dickeya dadantii 3937]|uniref:Uncharacterized protein n=1 Tax=Dickeya dadantii (strain 3937) TaxID=198628 RepID=E0SKA0_DICD3|nr:hypothetical protein Dda3937_04539 [Dickeya dadantii 3937]
MPDEMHRVRTCLTSGLQTALLSIYLSAGRRPRWGISPTRAEQNSACRTHAGGGIQPAGILKWAGINGHKQSVLFRP